MVWPLVVVIVLICFLPQIRELLKAVIERVRVGDRVKLLGVELDGGHPGLYRTPEPPHVALVIGQMKKVLLEDEEIGISEERARHIVDSARREVLGPLVELWEEFADRPVEVVLSQEHSDPRGIAAAGTGLGDAMALAEIQSLLAAIGTPQLRVAMATPASSYFDPRSSVAVVAVGGPEFNCVSADIFGDAARRERFHFVAHDLVDAKTKRRFITEFKPKNREATDYGLVLLADNPHSAGVPVMVVAGSHALGSLGAALAVTDREVAGKLFEKIGLLSRARFEAVVRIGAAGGWVKETTLVDARVLAPASSLG